MSKCLGCGAKLQDKDKDKVGYVKDLTMELCERCFRITNYHENKVLKEVPKNPIPKLPKKGLAFFFIDYLNITNKSINYFKSVDMDKVLVISKSDIIPKSVYQKKIEDYLKDNFNINSPIIFVKSKSNNSIKKIINIMNDYPLKEFYFLGLTNAGKSTFLNALLDTKITVSEFPNTTEDFIKIKSIYGNIYDTAGLIYPVYKVSKLNGSIKEITYNLRKNETLVIDDSIKIRVGGSTSLTFIGPIVNIRKSFKNIDDDEVYTYKIANETNIVISGFGIIYVKKGTDIMISGISQEYINPMKSYFGGKNN